MSLTTLGEPKLTKMRKWDLTKLTKKIDFKMLTKLFAGIKFDAEETDSESEKEEERERPEKQQQWTKEQEVEMRRLIEENKRLRCQTESLEETMRKMEDKYESKERQNYGRSWKM